MSVPPPQPLSQTGVNFQGLACPHLYLELDLTQVYLSFPTETKDSNGEVEQNLRTLSNKHGSMKDCFNVPSQPVKNIDRANKAVDWLLAFKLS